MDMAFSDGRTDKCLKVNGKWAPKMVLEYGHHQMVAITKDNGT
jgi:hypothetical protein